MPKTFEEAILNKIVEQFFTGFSFEQNGFVQQREAPVQTISKQLYQELMPEIITELAKRLDKQEFYDKLAVAVTQAFESIPKNAWDKNTFRADVRKEMVRIAAEKQLADIESSSGKEPLA